MLVCRCVVKDSYRFITARLPNLARYRFIALLADSYYTQAHQQPAPDTPTRLGGYLGVVFHTLLT